MLITEHEGNVAHATYDFTPDESKLVYSTNEFGEFNQAWTHDLETGEKAPLIEADWDVSYVFYSPSGKYQVHAINADGLTDLTMTDTQSGEAVVLNGVPEGELGQIRFSRDESKIAFGLNTDTSPYNLYMTELGGEAVRLTDALNPEIREENLVTATAMPTYRSSSPVVHHWGSNTDATSTSTRVTSTPARAAASAADSPPGPEPTTRTSVE